MSILKYKLENIEFDIKVLVTLEHGEGDYYSYIEIDKDRVKKYIEGILYIGKPSKFEIEKDIHTVIDDIFEDTIEVKRPKDLVVEVEDDYRNIVDVDTEELKWGYVFSVDIDKLEYKLKEM